MIPTAGSGSYSPADAVGQRVRRRVQRASSAMPSRASSSARSFGRGRHGRAPSASARCGAPRRVEPLPELDILHRLLVGGAPAVALPAVDPLRDAVAQILAVGVKVDRGTAA